MLIILLTACLRDDVADLKTNVTTIEGEAAARDASVDERLAALEVRLTAAETRVAAVEGELALLNGELIDQGVQLADLQTRLEEAEGGLLDLAGSLFGNELRDNDQQAALDALSAALDELGLALDDQVLSSADVAVQVADAEAAIADLETAVGDLGGLSSSIVVGATTQNYAAGGQSATWGPMSADVTLTLDVAGPVVTWCSAMDYSGNSSYRLSIESADGSWSDVGEVLSDNSSAYLGSREWFTAMGAFDAPAPGDYIVSCEGYFVNGIYDLTLIALAG